MNKEFRIISLHNGISTENFDSILNELFRLDFDNIKNLKIEDEGTPEQWSRIFYENPETWRVLVDHENRVLGYWHYVPLKRKTYERIKFGKIHEMDIKEIDVDKLESKKNYRIYFRSMVIDRRIRGTGASRLMIDSFFEIMEYLARREIFIEEICANAYTPEGEKLCRNMKMQFIKENTTSGKLYYLVLKDPENIDVLKNRKSLFELYSEKFSVKNSGKP